MENEEREERKPPVTEGELIDVQIIGTGRDGDGIAKFEGFVIIVPKAKEGESHEVRITRVMPRVAFSEIVNPGE